MSRTALLLSTVALGATLIHDAAAAEDQSSANRVDEIVVTGSRLAGGDRLAPVQLLDMNTLDAAGVLDLSGVLALISSNSGSEARIDQLNNPQSSGTAQFNLRNLGLGTTLVLVDGQRWTNSAVIATDGSAFVDINSLMPAIALERIEVVKDGASAVYGSDAVAGVVNFITRRDVLHPELRIRHAGTKGSDETALEGIGALDVLDGRLVLAGAHFHRSALGSDERSFTQAQRYGREPWTAVTSYGQPGSYYLPSSGQFAPDPDCDNALFIDTYRNDDDDPFCRLDYSDYFDLMPEETRTQLFAAYRRPLGGAEFKAQAAWANTATRARQSPSLPILSRNLTVPADHPDNPFGEDVLFRGRLLGGISGASVADFDYETFRLSAAITGWLGTGWQWEVSATASQQDVAYDKPDVKGAALQDALNGVNGVYYNPFGSAYLGTGTANDDEMLAALAGWTRLKGRSSLVTLDTHLSGNLLNGPDLTVDMVAGLQVRVNRMRHDWSDEVNAGDLLTAGYSPDFQGRQDAIAGFVETRTMIGARLEAQLAARYETYDGNRGKLSPKMAVRWDALNTLALRGSYGQGYRAPSVYTTQGAQAAQPSVFDRNAFVFVNTLTSGREDLRPERSEHATLGVLWEPVEGLRVTLDRWRFDYSDLVIKEAPQTILDRAVADDLAGLTGTDAQQRVSRTPSGSISRMQLYFVNAPSIVTEGFDIGAAYEQDVGPGTLSLSVGWTAVDRYDIQTDRNASVVSGLGSTNTGTLARSLPRHRGELSARWVNGRHSITGLAHYTSRYSNDRPGITRTLIASHTTADLHYSLEITPSARIDVGVVNIADKAPPLAQFFLGYDPVAADPRGRVISIGLLKRF